MKIVITLLICINCYVFTMVTQLAVPMKHENTEVVAINKLSATFGIPYEIARGLLYGSLLYRFDPYFVGWLLWTESEFKITAQSPKGYKGIAQTPTATFRAIPDMAHGMDILIEKFRLANWDTEKAVALYKGGDNPEAHKYARQMIAMYDRWKSANNR